MDIKKKLKNVEKKIVSFSEDFNSEERFLILNNEKLLKEYVIELSKNPNIWKTHEIFVDDTISVDYLDDKELTNVMINILFSYYKKNHALSFSIIDELVRAFNCPANTRNVLARKFTDLILSEEYDLCEECDTYAMAVLLKNDKKDIIANLKSFEGSISEKMLENYYSYCIKNKIEPIIDTNNLRAKISLKYLDYYSIDTLLRLLVMTNTESPEEVKLQVYNTLINKINSSKEDVKINMRIEGIAYQIPLDRANKIYEALYKKGYYVYSASLVQNKIISEEDLKEKIREYCLTKEEMDGRVLKRNLKYLTDKDVLLSIARSNQIKILFAASLLDEYKKNKKEIIEELVNNKNIKTLLSECTFNEMCNNPDLTLEMAKREFFTTIKHNPNDSGISTEDISLLKVLLDKYNLKLELTTHNYNSYKNHGLLKLLIERGYYEDFIKLANDNQKDIELIKEHLDEIINYIDQNVVSLHEFSNKFVLFILDNNKLLDFYANNDIYLTEILFDRIRKLRDRGYIHNNSNYFTPQIYKKFYSNIIKLYHISEEGLDVLYKRFGPEIIGYLDNETIRELTNLDVKDLKRIVDIFPKDKLTMNDLTNAYLSIREYTFSKDNPEQAEIFNLLVQAINEKNEEKTIELVKQLNDYFDDKLFEQLNDKYKLVESGFNRENSFDLLLFITSKIKMSPDKNKYLNLLHVICDYYVACKRKEYADVDKMGELLKLPYELEQKGLDEKITKYIIRHESNRRRMQDILEVLLDAGLTQDIIMDLFKLIRGTKKAEDIPKESLKHLKLLRETIYNYVEENGYVPVYAHLIEKKSDITINKVYSLDKASTLNIFKILSNVNIKNLVNIINGDNEMYESLKELFCKKKIHLLPSNILNVLHTDKVNINYNEGNIAAILNYYPQLYTYEQKKIANRKKKLLVEVTNKINNLIASGKESKTSKLQKKKKQLEEELLGNVPVELTAAAALLSSEAYTAISSVFALVLTPEDARLIKDNPDPNSAIYKIKNNGRLKESVELTKTLFTRNEVTVPTSNSLLKLGEGRNVRVIVGNFTDPCNLTYGERSGSCMRIGGVGDNLFHNAIENKNAFHIKFEDEDTHEYLSRVTGFRIGNTVFLNELKPSQNEDVCSDQELAKILKHVSMNMIEKSKKSSYPIENVVISNNGFMNDYKNVVDLQIGEEGETIGEIYNNINPSSCLVLATSSKDDFAPVNFHKENLPSYLPARRKARKITDKDELLKWVNRVEAVKYLLDGGNYQLLQTKFIEQEVLSAIVNDEWYIYIDSDLNVFSNCIETDERAVAEYKEYINLVEENIQKLKKQTSI